MRKLIVVILMFIMVLTTACAECSTYMPQSVSVTIEKSECKSMFIIDSNNELSGIKNMREANSHLPFNVSEYGTRIRGILNDGTVLRSRGLAQLTKVEDYWFGFTPFNVEIELFNEYKELVTSIVKARVNAETLNNPAVIASTLWVDGDYAGHIFYTSSTRRAQVGRVIFVNQDCYANLWAGDIDGNGELELGFIPGTWYVPAPNEKKDSNITVTVTTTTSTNCTNNKTTSTNSSCGTTVVNKGNGNNITTTTSTKINGNNNTTTTTNNTTNTITLFGVTINKNVNTTTTTVTNKTVRRPHGTMRDSIRSPGLCG